MFPLLWSLVVASGCAALIYEVVWFQLLQLVIGSSTVSVTVLLGTFMGGMCIGSLALPRLVSVGRHPLRIYAYLEIGIGLSGVLVLAVAPSLGAVAATMCLIPPTLLMGATLPAISRWTKVSREGIPQAGLLYAGNITGAVLGCLVAGFYLLRVYDASVATGAAVTINIGGALAALRLSTLVPYKAEPDFPPPFDDSRRTRADTFIYAAAALSGNARQRGGVPERTMPLDQPGEARSHEDRAGVRSAGFVAGIGPMLAPGDDRERTDHQRGAARLCRAAGKDSRRIGPRRRFCQMHGLR